MRTTLEDGINEFLATIEPHVRVSTYRDYERVFQNTFLKTFQGYGYEFIHEITLSAIERFFRDGNTRTETKKGWSGNTNDKYSVETLIRGWYLAITPEQDVYVMDVTQWKLVWPESKRRLTAIAIDDTDECLIAVEPVAFQLAAVQELDKVEELFDHTVMPAPAGRDKLSYALPLASRAQAGKVYLVEGAWNDPFIEQLCVFKGDGRTHDDMVDAATIA